MINTGLTCVSMVSVLLHSPFLDLIMAAVADEAEPAALAAATTTDPLLWSAAVGPPPV